MIKQSSPHGKNFIELSKMKMTALLSLVTKHGLSQHIHLYKRMKKPELVKALGAYEKKVPANKQTDDVKDSGRGKRVKKQTAKMNALPKGKGKINHPKTGMTYFKT